MALLEVTAEWRSKEATRMMQLIDKDVTDRKEWEGRVLLARNMYYGNESRLDVSWEGSSDIHLPVIQEKVETIVPKMKNAFWNIDPLVVIERTPEDFDPEESRVQQQFMNWALQYDIPDLFTTTISWFRAMLIDGVGVIKTKWVTKWRRTCERHQVRTHWRKGELMPTGYIAQEPEPKDIEDILDEKFGAKNWALDRSQESGGNSLRLTLIEDRREIRGVKVVFKERQYGPDVFVDEVTMLVYRPILIQDSPSVENVSADNLILPSRSKHIQTADRVTHRYWMTPDEILYQASPEMFDPWVLTEEDSRVLKEIMEGASSPNKHEEQVNNQALVKQRDEIEGTTDSKTANDPKNSRLLMYEVYTAMDLDGDGIREEVVLQICARLNKVVHVTYLDIAHPHSRRPFATIHYMAPDQRFYEPGMAYFLAPTQMQVNTIINQVNDRQELINNPIWFFQPAGNLVDAQILQNLPPGSGVPTANPQSIVFPQWGSSPMADMHILDSVLQFGDRISVSPMSGGSQPKGGPRTARGTLALMSEGNTKVDILVDMAQREGLPELMRQLCGLYGTFMPDEKHYWVTGREKKKIPEMMARKYMRGQFQFTFRGNTTNTNPEIQKTNSQLVYQLALSHPAYQMDPQASQEVLRYLLRNHLDSEDQVNKMMPKMPGAGAMPHPPMSQEHEIMAMRIHRYVEVLQTDNHLDHMQKIQRFTESPQFESLDEPTVKLLAQHYQGHQQALQQQQMLQQQAQAGGSVNGGGGGPEQGVGLGGLEGGVQ